MAGDAGSDPDRALEKYAAQAAHFQRTAELCSNQGIRYQPLVFSAQGSICKSTEFLVSRLAALIETQEAVGFCAADASGEFLQSSSRSLAQQAELAHVRRCGRVGGVRTRAGFASDVVQAAAREHRHDYWQSDVDSTAFGTDGERDDNMDADEVEAIGDAA